MPAFVAGYYIPFADVHTLMQKLEIDERGVEEDRLEFPINNWLAETGKTSILAGAIAHPSSSTSPQEDGMLFMVRAIVQRRDRVVQVEERERNQRVKEWLINEGGVNPDVVEWVALWDDFGLTREGFAPGKNDIRGPRRRARTHIVPDDQFERWAEYERTHKDCSLGDFVRLEEQAKKEIKE